MYLKLYLWGIGIAAIIGWLVTGAIILGTDPGQININIFVVFFASLFLAFTGTVCLIGFTIRVKAGRGEIIYNHMGVSARQAVLLSLILVGLLLLQAVRVLNWWDGVLLVAAILMLELYFKSK